MRLANLLAFLSVLTAALGGCGGSDEDSAGGTIGDSPANTSTAPAGASARSCGGSGGSARALRATGLPCEDAKNVALLWASEASCKPRDASRSACTVGEYRCLAAATDRGHAVSCASPGRSLAFTVRR